MAKAINGNPDLDRDIVQRFAQAHDAVRSAVTDVLGNGTARNLGLDSFDSVETTLRETRLEIDRFLVELPRWKTIRSRQSLGGALASINRRITDIEEALAPPGSSPETGAIAQTDSSQSASPTVPVEEAAEKSPVEEAPSVTETPTSLAAADALSATEAPAASAVAHESDPCVSTEEPIVEGERSEGEL